MLNVASLGAFGPLPGQASYVAAKAFVLSYTDSIRGELRGSGVTATALCPGPVKTGFVEAAGISDEDAEAAMPAGDVEDRRRSGPRRDRRPAAGKGVGYPVGVNRAAGCFSTGWCPGT